MFKYVQFIQDYNNLTCRLYVLIAFLTFIIIHAMVAVNTFSTSVAIHYDDCNEEIIGLLTTACDYKHV